MNIHGKNVSEKKNAHEALKKKAFELRERIKELNCLYSISNLVAKKGIPLEEIMQGIVDLIPAAWQYPEITCARITMKGREYQTANFLPTKWIQTAAVKVDDESDAAIEVCYLEKKPELDDGPFLKEEKSLIKAIAERLGRIIKRMQIQVQLQESEEKYRVLTENVADGVSVVQEGKYVFANKAFAKMIEFEKPDQIIETRAEDHISNEFKQQFLASHKGFLEGIEDESVFRGKCITKYGKEIWVEERHNIIKWRDKPAVLSTIRDITKNKLKEIVIKEESKYLRQENINLRSFMKEKFSFGNIIGVSGAMSAVYELILKAAKSNANVIICGESGTGKELAAQAIHNNSGRKNKEFVAVNCGAIPETLLESEFFGYKKGAFTGAVIDKLGYLDIANSGTLFLDEIGDLQLNIQVKLLRAIDDAGYLPVGSTEKRMTNFRIIAATNKNLKDCIIKGLMREDFYYRINVIQINMPPLRDRREDIPFLVEHFLKSYDKNLTLESIPKRIMDYIYHYEWPGNVRELKNVLQRYIAVGDLGLTGFNFAHNDLKGENHIEVNAENNDLQSAIGNFERRYILRSLEKNNWHKKKTADELCVSRNTFFRKIKKLNIN